MPKKNEYFDEIAAGLNTAIDDFKTSKKLVVRKVDMPPVPADVSSEQVRQIRTALNLSQSLFARLLNVSVKTVQAWEQGERKPGGPSLRLLEVAARHPQAILS